MKARFPDFSANQVRSLVVASAVPLALGDEIEAAGPAAQQDAVRRLVGYGRPSMARATESTSHRVVLVAEDEIPVDGVHVYELPIPASFRRPGGQRGIDVALAYDPRTRARRLDYLSSRMEFHLFRGMPVEEILESVGRLEPDEDIDIEEFATDDEDVREVDGAEEMLKSPPPPTLSELGSKVSKLVPGSTIRSAGANQLGRKVFSRRFDPQHEPVHLVLRNTNRWDDETARQGYALTVVLWRSETHGEIHVELETMLEAVIELPVEIELEA